MQESLFSNPMLNRLKNLRRDLAARKSTELYKIWSNATMDLILAAKPKDVDDLAKIKGLGAKKIASFGEEIIKLFDDAPTPTIAPQVADEPLEKILGVSDFLDYINQVLKIVHDVKVLGEISSIKQHPTGVYMTLKDKSGDGVLECYINPYTYRGLGLPLEEGMEVKISGVPGIFKRRSQLSFRVESLELAGEGTLKKAYELLKAKLEQEGLFDRKRDLPEFISRVGIVTSRSGAVIDDFRKNLEFLGIKLYLKDVRVEGTQAASQILRAIKYFNVRHPDLDCLVIMRGGGSLEDLQAFNNEAVVKEIFASRIPTIAAIGHDRDVPLTCLVADHFTSTPTAAATLINNSWSRLKTQLPRLQSLLLHNFELNLEDKHAQLSSLTHQLTGSFNQIFQRFNYLAEKVLRGVGQIEISLRASKEKMMMLLTNITTRLARAIQSNIDLVNSAQKLLYAANPERNLKLGYSLAYNSNGKIIRASADAKIGDEVHIKLHQGGLDTKIINKD